ncbi:peroxisomal membrane protein 11B-like [Acanthaster planci]|uniref:Peroxisomal membrane protein 11B-like n=1 Tax=Acanthaster planci TaxID=133434 RepID=A0A8B7Z961_ACAPL|nr:peroxisomal membrane protein 11B-like [Acanthaster planci]
MSEEFVNRVIKLGSQTSGRDKLYRTFQYGSKFLGWCLEQGSGDQDLIQKIKALERTLSTSRKLLRLGKSLDMLTGALKTIHLEDTFLQVTITLSKLNQALYLLIDHALWAHRIGIVKANNERLTTLSSRFWLATLILNLSRDLYELMNVVNNAIDVYMKQREHRHGDSPNGDLVRVETNLQFNENARQLDVLAFCLQSNKPIVLDLVKNAADLFLPLSSLGYLAIPAGIQGLCGLISSLVGLATVWDAKLKLQP